MSSPTNRNSISAVRTFWAKVSTPHSSVRSGTLSFRCSTFIPNCTKHLTPGARQNGSIRPLTTVVALVVWLVVLGGLAYNRQNLQDWWRLRGYEAPAIVASLAEQNTMTDYARKVFYVNRPVVEDKAAFNRACPDNAGREQTIVLGCYHGNQAGIFLLKVTDPRLDGVEQVTAAHEMLHAAYERLSQTDRQRVDGLLNAYYTKGLRDERILKTITAYKTSEPNDVVNEMHSIFATEIENLPKELEQYYQRYFTDRTRVAAFAAQYQAAFTSRQTAVTAYDTQLTQLKSQIETAETDLQTKQAEITERQQNLNELRNSDNAAAYNAGIPAYNNLVEAYNQQVAQIKNLIERYNQIVAERNAIALEQDKLSKELDSNAIPLQQ